jgi:catechol 2,3-dioxygenase-like lactoylglutathione lyase family enzyme
VITREERTMPATATRITQVGTVFVPVADQDRSLEFYVDKLGFDKCADFPDGEGRRWVEVAPPGSAMVIALVPSSEGEWAAGGEARCAFASEDIQADHATLRARGVDVDAEIARTGTSRSGLVSVEVTVPDPVPAQFFFRDIDGNRFLIVSPPDPAAADRAGGG